MMDRSALVHTVVAIVAVVLAWAAWADPVDWGEPQDSVVVPGAPEQLTQIGWSDAEYDIQITRSGEGARVAVTQLDAADSDTGKTVEVAEKDATAAKTRDGETPPAKIYPGSSAATDLFAKLAPLTTKRVLGTVDSERRAAMGLDDPSAQLMLGFGDRTETVAVGDATYGTGDLYASAQDSVFLLRAKMVNMLRHGASRLIDKELFGFEASDIARVIVSDGRREREAVHRHAGSEEAFYADPAVPDEPLEGATQWIHRLLTLRIVDVVQNRPAGAPAVTVTFNEGGSLGRFELWPPDKRTAVATSTRFERPVTISKAQASALLRELDAVLQDT